MRNRISRRTFLRHIGIGTGAAAWAASGLNFKTASALDSTSMASVNRLAQTSFSYWVVFTQTVSASLKDYNAILCYQELGKRTADPINFQLISDQGTPNNDNGVT